MSFELNDCLRGFINSFLSYPKADDVVIKYTIYLKNYLYSSVGFHDCYESDRKLILNL